MPYRHEIHKSGPDLLISHVQERSGILVVRRLLALSHVAFKSPGVTGGLVTAKSLDFKENDVDGALKLDTEPPVYASDAQPTLEALVDDHEPVTRFIASLGEVTHFCFSAFGEQTLEQQPTESHLRALQSRLERDFTSMPSDADGDIIPHGNYL